MDLDQVRAFIAIVDYGSISAAAEFLFQSQSNISTRIKKLEQYLGVELIIRKKGHKHITLTPYGQYFEKIAHQMIVLEEDSLKLKNLLSFQELNIASVDLVNNYTFVYLYQTFTAQHPNIKLNIQTFHSNEIHQLVESNVADIGLVYSQLKYPNIYSEPIFRELNYLVCHKDNDYYDGIEPADLDLSKEVFINWGADFYQWHYCYFGNNDQRKITVNTGSLLPHFLTEPNTWTIAPMSAIKYFNQSHQLAYYTLSSPPPPRICYAVTRKDSPLDKKPTIDLFRQEMKNFIESDYSICTFHNWMIENNTISQNKS